MAPAGRRQYANKRYSYRFSVVWFYGTVEKLMAVQVPAWTRKEAVPTQFPSLKWHNFCRTRDNRDKTTDWKRIWPWCRRKYSSEYILEHDLKENRYHSLPKLFRFTNHNHRMVCHCLRLEVCTGLRVVLGSRPDPARGPGLGAQIMFGSGPGSNDSNETLYREFRAFSDYSFFAKRKLFVVALILCSWHSQALETNPTDLTFSGIFLAAPSQK
jgi:hypothetical protein